MDLKAFLADVLQMSAADLAQRIDESEADVSEWEQTGQPPLSVIEKIAHATGLDFNTILGGESAQTNNTCGAAQNAAMGHGIAGLFAEFIDGLTARSEPGPQAHENAAQAEATQLQEMQPEAAHEQVARATDAHLQNAATKAGTTASVNKPVAAAVGQANSSTFPLCEALYGLSALPITTYVLSAQDKPAFMSAEEDAWVFGKDRDGEPHWDPRRLQDEAYCRKWKIASGSFPLLRLFGAPGAGSAAAGSAVVFVDNIAIKGDSLPE